MKYLDWLKTNPEKGYYWVKYQDCDEERIDEFTDWYDNAGNKETRFTDQPDEVLGMVPHFMGFVLSNVYLNSMSKDIIKLKEQVEEANKLIKWVQRSSWSCNQEEDDFDRYIKKWDVK